MKKNIFKIKMLLITMSIMVLTALKTDIVCADDGVIITAANFPDSVFRNYVKKYDLDNDKMLSASEISAVQEMKITGLSIDNLTGIEYFEQLKALDCSGLGLNTLVISDLPMLRTIDCSDNNLVSVDFSNSYNLYSIDCSNNKMTELDVSNCDMRYLDCSDNMLTTLDLACAGCYYIVGVNCANNQLSYLDLSVAENLTSIDYSGNPLYAIIRSYSASNSLVTNTVSTTFNKSGNSYVMDWPECMSGDMASRIVACSSGTISDGYIKWSKFSDVPAKLTYTLYTANDYYDGMALEDAENGQLMKVTVNLTYAKASSVKLNRAKVTLKIGGKKSKKTTTLKMTGVSEKVTWKSSNPKVAKVNSKGVITAKKKGKTVVSAKIGNITRKCIVTVEKIPAKKNSKKKK